MVREDHFSVEKPRHNEVHVISMRVLAKYVHSPIFVNDPFVQTPVVALGFTW